MADKCCYSNNGMTFRWVPSDYAKKKGEVLSDDVMTTDQREAAFPGFAKAIASQEIKDQIIALEITVTPRRMREAITGTDNGWLNTLNNQIAVLRNEL